MVGQAMKKRDMPIRHDKIKRRRIRTVIERLMLIAGHLTVTQERFALLLEGAVPGRILLLEYSVRYRKFKKTF